MAQNVSNFFPFLLFCRNQKVSHPQVTANSSRFFRSYVYDVLQFTIVKAFPFKLPISATCPPNIFWSCCFCKFKYKVLLFFINPYK
ncbi:hypothetical protein CW304_06890 [Bacillus sp. UFRGS-B20]|nr:hypothetical protein CW304_06890 [Bacillus sp. UFRGS-B20]